MTSVSYMLVFWFVVVLLRTSPPYSFFAPSFLGACGTIAATVIGFLETLRYSGFRLVRYESKADYAKRLEGGAFHEQVQRDRRCNRVLTAILFFVMVGGSVVAGVMQKNREVPRKTGIGEA
jgi:hypothetical protein